MCVVFFFKEVYNSLKDNLYLPVGKVEADVGCVHSYLHNIEGTIEMLPFHIMTRKCSSSNIYFVVLFFLTPIYVYQPLKNK